MWKQLFKTGVIFFLFLSLSTLTSCNKDDDKGGETSGDIMGKASAESDLSLFVTAVKKAGLENKLKSENVTVLAPVNSAFTAFLADLGYQDLDEYIAVNTVSGLSDLLLYHCFQSSIMVADFKNGYFKTLSKNSAGHNMDMFIKANDSAAVTFNGEENSISEADIMADNGVIHKLNGVLFPPNLRRLIQLSGEFLYLQNTASFIGSDLMDFLEDENSVTLFAPDDAAFNAFFQEHTDFNEMISMVNFLGNDYVNDMLQYHSMLTELRSSAFVDGNTHSTGLIGSQFTLMKDTEGNFHLKDQQGRNTGMLLADITATNGSFHIIENLILP